MSKPKYNFIIRLSKSKSNSCLYSLSDITISGITIINKNAKFELPKITNNINKFGYNINIKGNFLRVGGSNSYPVITFKDEFIDIEIKNFPRFPAFYETNNPWVLDPKNKDLSFGHFTERIEFLNIKTM